MSCEQPHRPEPDEKPEPLIIEKLAGLQMSREDHYLELKKHSRRLSQLHLAVKLLFEELGIPPFIEDLGTDATSS